MNLLFISRTTLEDRPIPSQRLAELRASESTYDKLIDKDDRRSNEPLVDIREWVPGENHFWIMKKPPVPLATSKLLVRKSFSTLLTLANFHLHKLSGGELCLFIEDAHRTLALQRDRYEYNLRKIREKNPGMSEKYYRNLMRGFYSEVSDSRNVTLAPPPHPTGGASDFTCRYVNTNALLYMGGKSGEMKWPDYFEIQSKKGKLSPNERTAMKNRRLVYWIMVGVGIAPSPTEFWHISYGDQMWAEFYNKSRAFYGLAEI